MPGVADPTITNTVVVSVRDLPIAADIGVYAHEMGRLPPLLVSVDLSISAPDSDDLAATFDYAEIGRLAHLLAEERIALIETFASRLATACLARSTVTALEVRVEKPGALAAGTAGTRVTALRPRPVEQLNEPAWRMVHDQVA
jgi:dihydroneopterin aldolase